MVKKLPPNAGDIRNSGSIPGLGTSPEEEHGHPLQYSSLENPMDRGGWWVTVHGVAKSWTRLSDLARTQYLFEGCFEDSVRITCVRSLEECLTQGHCGNCSHVGNEDHEI